MSTSRLMHRRSPRRIAVNLLVHIALILACLAAVYPLLRVFSVSLRPGDRLFSSDLRIVPPDATWDNYLQVLFHSNFLYWIWNSLVVAVSTSFLGVSIATCASYAFSRRDFPGRKAGMLVLLCAQMLPSTMLLLPLFIMLSRLRLINTYLGLIIAYSMTALPFSIWLLKGYFDTVSPSLEEAAMLDGASAMGAFLRVTLRLSTPSLAIAGLFNFMIAWNEYIVARVILQKSQMYTWTLGLYEFQGVYTTQWGLFAAASVMISIPVTSLFLLSSRWLLSGLTIGAMKG